MFVLHQTSKAIEGNTDPATATKAWMVKAAIGNSPVRNVEQRFISLLMIFTGEIITLLKKL